MKLLIIFALAAFSQARIINQQCDGVVIRNVKYIREILVDNVHSPYQLSIDNATNTLYFSESIENGQNEVFKISYLNLNTKEYGSISEVPGGFSSAVDNVKHVVYFGCREGIYTYDYKTKTVECVGAKNHSIWQMFYSDTLYYSTYPDETVYSFNGVSERVPELNDTKAMLVAFDKNRNIYFSNSTGLFCYKRSVGKIFTIGQYSYNVNAFTSDSNGNLYFSTPGGIYYINGVENTIDLLVTFNNVYGLAIDRDNNIIYSEENVIVRLRMTDLECSPSGDLNNVMFDDENMD